MIDGFYNAVKAGLVLTVMCVIYLIAAVNFVFLVVKDWFSAKFFAVAKWSLTKFLDLALSISTEDW